MEAIETIDFAILDAIQGALRCDAADAFMAAVSLIGGGFLWAAVGFFLLFFKKYRFCGIALLTSTLTALLLTECLLKLLILRERPYLSNPEITLAVAEPLGTSFPSSHTGTSFAAAVPLFRGKRLWGVLGCGFAALVGFSRLYLYVHFPSDVAVGMILGIGVGLCFLFLFKRIEQKRRMPSGGTPAQKEKEKFPFAEKG